MCRIASGVHKLVEAYDREAEILIAGRACRLPGAPSIAAFWDVLRERRCTIGEVGPGRWPRGRYLHPRPGEPGKTYTFRAGTLDDPWAFDPAPFGISPREAAQIDPQQRLALELVWEALEDAGVPPSQVAGTRVGVYVGASSVDHGSRRVFDAAGGDGYYMTGSALSLIANRISHAFDFTGPSLVIDTACSSSLVALHEALTVLRAGLVDAAVVAGVNVLLSPFPFIGFAARGEGASRRLLAEGGMLFAIEPDAGAFNDFIFGLADGRRALGRRLRGDAQWCEALARTGLRDVEARRRDDLGGAIVLTAVAGAVRTGRAEGDRAAGDRAASGEASAPKRHARILALEDATLANLSTDAAARVLAPKVDGARHLDRLTRDCRLDHFVLYSSATTLFGNPGQAVYVAANGYLEGIAHARAAAGLPALAIAWGAISNAGYVARSTSSGGRLDARLEAVAMTAEEALRHLEAVLANPEGAPPVVTLAPLDWVGMARLLPMLKRPTFAALSALRDGDAGEESSDDPLVEIDGLDTGEAVAVLARHLARVVGRVLRAPAAAIDTSRPLADMGIDSLMTIELQFAAKQRFGVELPLGALVGGASIEDMAVRLLQRLRGVVVAAGEADRVLLSKHLEGRESAVQAVAAQ